MEEKFDKKSEKSEVSVSAQTIGVVLARTLLDELNADRLPEPAEGHKQKWVEKLCPVVPKRGGQVAFQQKEGEDLPKFEFSIAFSSGDSEDDKKRIFCMSHGEFVPYNCTASEHAYPYAKIRENQERLLAFLNAAGNEEISKAFLQFDGISDYFGYGENGAIQGSIYFYKHCYNIMDNLFLMCQGCNTSKGDKEPISWFLKQNSYFGQPFVEHISRLGGLREGILLYRVYPTPGNCLEISFGEGAILRLPAEGVNAAGLGAVVMDWFFEHYGGIFEIHKDFYKNNSKPIKEHLEGLGRAVLEEHASVIAVKMQLKLRRNMKTLSEIQGSLISKQKEVLHQVQAGMNIVYSSPSSQDSEESELSLRDKRGSIAAFENEYKARHYARGLRRIIKSLFGKEIAREFYCHTDDVYLNPLRLTGEDWKNIYMAFVEYLADFNREGKNDSDIKQEIKSKLFQSHAAEQEKYGVVPVARFEAERVEREAVLAEKEAEKAEKEKAQARVLELEKKLALLEQAKEEKKEIDTMQVDSPHDEESPPLSPSSTAPATSFFSKEEGSKDDKKRKREEGDDSPKHKVSKTDGAH